MADWMPERKAKRLKTRGTLTARGVKAATDGAGDGRRRKVPAQRLVLRGGDDPPTAGGRTVGPGGPKTVRHQPGMLSDKNRNPVRQKSESLSDSARNTHDKAAIREM